jgi:20S proteasome subunit alpha 3
MDGNVPLVEFATVGKTKDGRIYHHLWGADEITTLLREHDRIIS